MMKRKVMITAAAVATMICSAVSAAPLTDYSVGKTSIDLVIRSSDNNIDSAFGSTSYDKKVNLDWGITTGLGSKFAIQYNGYNAKSKTTTFSNALEKSELKSQEFNILYQIDKNLSVYAGSIKVKPSVAGYDFDDDESYDYSFSSKNKVQFGLIGSTKIADKTTAYASLAFASDITNWKIGVSQEIAPNLEFNIDYRSLKVKDINFAGTPFNFDATSKGFGYGVTYKF